MLLYVSGLFKIDHAISFARMIVLAPNFGGPSWRAYSFHRHVFMQRCQQCCLASRTPFRLHFVVHAWRRIGVGQVQWIGFCSIMYWFGYGSLRISPLLLQASSKMPEIGVPAMPADAVPMGWTSVFYLFCCHRFCLVFWQSLHNKYQSLNGEEWKEKKRKDE